MCVGGFGREVGGCLVLKQDLLWGLVCAFHFGDGTWLCFPLMSAVEFLLLVQPHSWTNSGCRKLSLPV